MVPYRILSPFFRDELQGIKDSDRNRLIAQLAERLFENRRPLYMFIDNATKVIVHHDWMLYLYENIGLVRAFTAWNYLDYMQRRNPSVPNIKDKLFPPVARNSLSNQTTYWKIALGHSRIRCIYSGNILNENTMSLDHFIPWSFVAHDQMWNLLPVEKNINSSKSNRLPSMKKYLNPFIELQFAGLQAIHRNSNDNVWRKVTEPYVSDLNIPKDNLFQIESFGRALKQTIIPLETIARNRGFAGDWVYKG